MNQTELVQNIIATDHQARAVTENAKVQRENLDAAIDAEIEALRVRYQQEADEYLSRLKADEEEKTARTLQELDAGAQARNSQVRSIYEAKKDQWVQAIFDRVVGKAAD